MAVGTITQTTASTSSSAATAARHSPNAAASIAAVVSTGFAIVAPDGRISASRCLVGSEIGASTSPSSMQASAASTPAPPALDTTATRRPAGQGWQDRNAAVPISSPRLSVAMTPACSNSASRVTSGVAAAAVCDFAARWPSADRPPTTVSTGIWRPTRRAVVANLRGLPNDSRYKIAIRVC